MFCTSLRRRASIANGIAGLSTALGLRENSLQTHDLEVPFSSNTNASVANTNSPARRLRVLLLVSSSALDQNLTKTLERISHFSLLTGGQDVLIVFLLHPPLPSAFVTANQLHTGTSNDSTDPNGMYAYSKLQVKLLDHAPHSSVPILPINSLNDLPSLLQRHITNISRPPLPHKPTARPFELLQFCTANPPMAQRTAHILTDIFVDLRDLATTCASATAAPDSSSPGMRGTGSQVLGGSDGSLGGVGSQGLAGQSAGEKLRELHTLVGETEFRDVVDFWKEEWTFEQ